MTTLIWAIVILGALAIVFGLIQLLGHAQEGADAQKLGQHVVVYQNGRHDNG